MNIRKLLLSALAVTLALPSTFAQGFNSKDNPMFIGIRASVDVTTMKESLFDVNVPNFDAGAGASIGAVLNVPLVANLYIEPGITAFFNTASQDTSTKRFGFLPIGEYKYNFYGIKIPIALGYHYDFAEDTRLSLFTGPVADIGIVGRLKIDNSDDSYDLYDANKLNYRRFNLDWRVGASMEYQNFVLSVGADFGMLDISGYDGLRSTTITTQISLGYNFDID